MDQIAIPGDDIHYDLMRESEPPDTPKWELLASLLGKTQHLVELNYAVVDMFPQDLLKALHQHHPACRLNLHAFRLKSINSPQFEPCEMDLIRSPCLHGVRYRYREPEEDDTIASSYEEKLYKIMSIAPNVKHFYAGIPDPLEWCPPGAIPKAEGLDPSIKACNMGTLKSLSLRCRSLREETLQKASLHTDFSKLESLNLDYVRSICLPRAIASTHSFRALRKMSVVLSHDLNIGAMHLMFESINPLTHLELRSSLFSSDFERILMRHGPTLQGLLLLPEPTYPRLWTPMMPEGSCANQVLQYAKLCPHLRSLHMETRRTTGDDDEIRLYEAYGQFPCLENLTLDMECSIPPDRSYDPKIVGTKMAAVASKAFNTTLDPVICHAIWLTITSKQKSSRLRKLELNPHGRRIVDGGGPDLDILSIAYDHMRSYILREESFDKQELPAVVEVDGHGPYSGRRYTERLPTRSGQLEALRQVDHAFETAAVDSYAANDYVLYPAWRSEWLAFPLQRLAMALLDNKGKRSRPGGASEAEDERETKLPRIAQ
jgi:hypothetical protein